jgi:NAD(P)-dependent dehydrogenase (short-subunit alcohol dehydrogenase family)
MSRPVAIVTGGCRGIGLAAAVALAEAGFDILVADLAEEVGTDVEKVVAAHGARLAYRRCDIADLGAHEAVVSAALEAFGRIDCLVNNAGVASPMRGDLLDLSPANFDRVMAVNLRGTIFLSQTVGRAMLSQPARDPRSIVTVTSISAEMASPERADYCVSKAGLSMWVKNLALRLAGDGIGVFEVRPGIIRTEMTAAVSAKYDAAIAGGLVPARRWGEASDVGGVVAALAAGRLGFATGSVVNVDGALSIPKL